MSDDNEPLIEELGDDDPFACWCGAMITEADQENVTGGCGGLGTLECECGGDGLCVCHNHGEIECPGCEDCDDRDDLGDDDVDAGFSE